MSSPVIVNTAVQHPRAVEIMKELNGKPVRTVFTEAVAPTAKRKYKVVFT